MVMVEPVAPPLPELPPLELEELELLQAASEAAIRALSPASASRRVREATLPYIGATLKFRYVGNCVRIAEH
jgi:hypothetical protein